MKRKLTEDRIKKLQDEVSDLLQNYEITHGLGRVLRLLSKEAALYQNHLQGIKNWQSKKDTFSTKKVQIGGGKHMLVGFLNIDIVPPADLVYDLREGIPLEDSCSEFVFNEHFFEHIDYPGSAKKIINEFFRILKPRGQVVLGVPDGELAIRSYMAKDREFYDKALSTWYAGRNCLSDFNTYIDLLNYHFRDQDDEEKYNPHYWAYDFEKLQSLFKNAGFSKIEKWKFNPSIASPKREWGSIYVIATK
ncbi:methyltransferase domain-containing protein [Candidatus Microgenomates bacterium]|jgi:SAM-dependent methyltransferase|nr:MAG: methyltransferase domain-containing protein [Candidatus Microgenomates bacterium]